MSPNASKPDTTMARLSEESDDRVVLTTADSDRFIKTQREIVSSMRGAEDMLARARKATDDLNRMIADIQAWCARQPRVRECLLCPRADDLLAVVVAADEDADGSLDDSLSALDLELFSRNGFRVTWLMLRASEAGGRGSFVGGADARTIYRA